MLTPILPSISLVVRGTEQKLTMSLCLLDNDTFGVSECLSRVSKSFSEVSKSVPECLSRVSWSVSECLSQVSESWTWLLFSSTWLPTWLLSPSTWLPTWLLSPSTWLLSSLQTVMTNSCVLSLFINVTLISSSSARVMPLPTPVYGSKYIALLKRNILRGMEVPALMSSFLQVQHYRTLCACRHHSSPIRFPCCHDKPCELLNISTLRAISKISISILIR